MMLLDNFLIRAGLAGLCVAITVAPLGCFVVWRRMAYFGDATAHASILSVVLALAFSTSVFVGVLVVSLIMAITVSTLSDRDYAMDTLLGVLAFCTGVWVGCGIVSARCRIDLLAYLFDDILAVGTTDLVVIWGGAVLVSTLICTIDRNPEPRSCLCQRDRPKA
jgi:zinc transport system permease protein